LISTSKPETLVEGGHVNAPGEPFRSSDERNTWLDPAEWKLVNKYTTGATQVVDPRWAGAGATDEAAARLRVEIFASRVDPTKVRVWAQLWQRLRGAAEFEPTDPILAFEVDFGPLVDQLVHKRVGGSLKPEESP
jgi:hypothetical protein